MIVGVNDGVTEGVMVSVGVTVVLGVADTVVLGVGDGQLGHPDQLHPLC